MSYQTFNTAEKKSWIFIIQCTFSVSISLHVIQDRRSIIVECVDWTVRLRGIIVLYTQYVEGDFS